MLILFLFFLPPILSECAILQAQARREGALPLLGSSALVSVALLIYNAYFKHPLHRIETAMTKDSRKASDIARERWNVDSKALAEHNRQLTNSLRDNSNVVKNLSHEPFGMEWASELAEVLQRLKAMHNNHRDYCGLGFTFDGNSFALCVVSDGSPFEKKLTWLSREAFIESMANHSEYSLSRADASVKELFTKDQFFWGNQTIGRDFIERFRK